MDATAAASAIQLNGGGDDDAVVKEIENDHLLECMKALVKGGERRVS